MKDWREYAGAAMGDLMTAIFTSDRLAAHAYLETALSNLYVAMEALKADLGAK